MWYSGIACDECASLGIFWILALSLGNDDIRVA